MDRLKRVLRGSLIAVAALIAPFLVQALQAMFIVKLGIGISAVAGGYAPYGLSIGAGCALLIWGFGWYGLLASVIYAPLMYAPLMIFTLYLAIWLTGDGP
jgi:hypothetical protein